MVAFDRRVRFKPFSSRPSNHYSRSGQLLIPIDPNWTEAQKPGWIVDGQQRSAAVREANLKRFPLCVTAFITRSRIEQRTQFILVNSTKPLPKGLVYELLPAIDWDKGEAMKWLLDTLDLDHKNVRPIYIGDDITDEDAFRALERSGIGILVSEQPQRTAARYSLKDPAEVEQFLRALTRHVSTLGRS